MSFPCWLQKLRNVFANSRGQRHHRRRSLLRAAPLGASLEILEDRCLLSFDPVASFPVGGSPQAIVTGDFNNDGHLDLATADPVANTVSVLLGDGAGSFGDAVNSSLGLHSVDTFPDQISLTVADFNNDGHDDLAMSAYNPNGYDGGYYSGPSVLLSNGDGTFGSRTYIDSYTAGYTYAVAAGDFNNDGNSDLAITGFDFWAGWDGIVVGIVQVLPGNGQGGFAQARHTFYSRIRIPT